MCKRRKLVGGYYFQQKKMSQCKNDFCTQFLSSSDIPIYLPIDSPLPYSTERPEVNVNVHEAENESKNLMPILQCSHITCFQNDHYLDMNFTTPIFKGWCYPHLILFYLHTLLSMLSHRTNKLKRSKNVKMSVGSTTFFEHQLMCHVLCFICFISFVSKHNWIRRHVRDIGYGIATILILIYIPRIPSLFLIVKLNKK